MPAVSKNQRKLFGMAYAYLKGELPNASKEVKDLAKSLKKKKIKEFAKTKHKGLPKKIKKKKSEIINFLIKLANDLDSKGLAEISDLIDRIGEQIITTSSRRFK